MCANILGVFRNHQLCFEGSGEAEGDGVFVLYLIRNQ